jgi:hypothetical protein
MLEKTRWPNAHRKAWLRGGTLHKLANIGHCDGSWTECRHSKRSTTKTKTLHR